MLAQKKILIVEDNVINRTMLREILAGDYLVLEAQNGQEALSVLKEHWENISLILLDIVMPVMDGYTFLSIVKADPLYSSIPVIVTTQKDGETDEVTALANGATDFVSKPYRPQVILHRVASIINLRETAAMINQFQYDRLTGLYSKEFFYRRANEILMRSPEREFDIIYSDIDNFKLINDVFGVPAGDQLLRDVADLFSSFVGGDGLCGRISADQFAGLVERDREYSDDMFMELSARIAAMTGAKNLTVKWGVYRVKDRAVSVEQMCDRALLAVRSIKGQYGKYFAFYDDALRSKLLREQTISESMSAALAQGQFVVYLQSKYRIRDNTLAGAEALVRWNHPQWGFLPPGEFIPLFEKNGFIPKLDEYVWERACAVMRRWDDAGLASLPVSVNVSRADIYKADIADVLMRLVKKYGIAPARLHLEITESAYTENPEQIIETVGQLRRLGFVIEMDDFGSGYSSLNMLNQMPLDVLKLDKSFIQNETAKPANQGILRFVIGLARWMNLSVVAEGVETAEQLERLREVGCDYVQGYYFAKPQPEDAFERMLRESTPPADAQPGPVDAGGEQPKRALLVADEDARYRESLRNAFQGRFTIVEAPDCYAFLDHISKQGAGLAAIVLSMTMPPPPQTPPFYLLSLLRRERHVWDVPVIATTPHDLQLEESAFALGADDVAVKPHSPKSLERRIQAALNASVSRAGERTLRHEEYRDPLTGLFNRRGLTAALSFISKEDRPLAVFLFDLDNMKQFNNQYGHAAGDVCFRQFAELLRNHTRQNDILARRGDEFIVIMRRMCSGKDALKKGEEICDAIRKREVVPGAAMRCSAGIILWDKECSLPEMLERAELALHRAKAGNKGGYCMGRD